MPSGQRTILSSSTHPRWFDVSHRWPDALLSDHLHCERKATENALSLVRRYPGEPAVAERLIRLAHEETSHLVQVAALMSERGLRVRADMANHYTRALLGEIRGREPARQLDALLCAGLIEARSHERLCLLARGFSQLGDARLGGFFSSLAAAEDRHAELFIELAKRTPGGQEAEARLKELSLREAEILADQPFGARIH